MGRGEHRFEMQKATEAAGALLQVSGTNFGCKNGFSDSARLNGS